MGIENIVVGESRLALDDSDAQYIVDLIHSESGVRLGLNKKSMIQARLIRRMQSLKIRDFSEYISFIRYFSEGLAERSSLVDALTTHKTDFFREKYHFDFLRETALPSLLQPRNLSLWRLWSAGCSTGKEAWSLAMVLGDYFGDVEHWRFNILGTDISSMVVEKAKKAVYSRSVAEAIPLEYRNFIMNGRGSQAGNIRIVPELRKTVTFFQENLFDTNSENDESFEIIFCRIFVIYFDLDATALLIKRLVRHLKSGGYLFIGHSETIDSKKVGLQQVGPTVFRKI